MASVAAVPLSWLVELINEHAPQTRNVAGEQDDPYPDLTTKRGAAGLPRPRLRDMIEIAERLWPVFASTSDDRIRTLNTLLGECALTPRLDETGQLRWATERRSARALLLAGCVASLLDVGDRFGWDRLGVCGSTDCVDVYVDLAGRGSRRYCSHGCLNRTRVRAYRSRQQTRRP